MGKLERFIRRQTYISHIIPTTKWVANQGDWYPSEEDHQRLPKRGEDKNINNTGENIKTNITVNRVFK